MLQTNRGLALSLLFLFGCGDSAAPTDASLPDAAFSDAGATDAAVQIDAGTDAGLSGCPRVCQERTRALLNRCFDADNTWTEADCLGVCAEHNLAAEVACFETAGEDCEAAEGCLEEPNPSPVSFEVSGTDAIMRGVIDSQAIAAVRNLIAEHPEVTRIVLQDVPGSLNDNANLRASRLVREAGLNTHVPADGVIASGGVDFFCAGVQRSAEVAAGARLGVHSWGTEEYRGDRVPRDDPAHQSYLDYYAEMGIPASFYWFTLEAAPPEGVHWMSTEEVDRYMLTTE